MSGYALVPCLTLTLCCRCWDSGSPSGCQSAQGLPAIHRIQPRPGLERDWAPAVWPVGRQGI